MEETKRTEYVRYGAAAERMGKADIYLSYTREELNSLRFYQGDTTTIILTEEEKNLADFYQVSNAYEVLNTLLFPGITNEQARIVDENRTLSKILLNHMSEVLNIYENMANLCYKYTCNANRQEAFYVNRFDREDSLKFLQKGQNCSFMSTTLAPDLKYFHTKSGLLLEKIEALPYIIHIDVNEVLGKQGKFSSEREILFPPFCKIKMEKEKLTEEELTYKDCHDHPPFAKYKVYILDNDKNEYYTWSQEQIQEKLLTLKKRILDKDQIEHAKYVWDTLKTGAYMCENRKANYESWKSFIQEYVRLIFAKSSRFIEKKAALLMRYNMFCNELQDCIVKNNVKREQYSKYVERSGIAITTFSALVSFLFALSFVDNEYFQLSVKILGLSISCIGLIITGICKTKAWEGKFHQRSMIFLKLDQLQRDLRYEENMDEAKLNDYIQRFKEIISLDATYCENNVQMTMSYLDDAMQNSSSGNV